MGHLIKLSKNLMRKVLFLEGFFSRVKQVSNKSNLQFNISSQNLRSEPNFRVQERLIQMSHDMPELKRKRF